MKPQSTAKATLVFVDSGDQLRRPFGRRLALLLKDAKRLGLRAKHAAKGTR